MGDWMRATPWLSASFLRAMLFRIVAVVLFVVGISYWMRLVGIDAGGAERFDLMPIWWQVAAPAMAVLYPVAGIGLWLLAGWGAVIWLIIAIAEAVMHLGFPELYGARPEWLIFHGLGLVLVATFRVVFLVQRSRGRYV